jgi:hypothetical protein
MEGQMPAQTYTARVVAGLVTKRVGRKVTDKQVRAWARDNIQRLMDDGYTHHEYTSAERDRIVNALAARRAARPMTGTPSRASSASKGRTPSKATSKASKAAKVAPIARVAPTVTPTVIVAPAASETGTDAS